MVAVEPSSYIATSRQLATHCVRLLDKGGESRALHSPENMCHTGAKHMSFDQRELNIICHWFATGRMTERYDRSVCDIELLLRSTTIQEISTGWELAPAFRLPDTASKH